MLFESLRNMTKVIVIIPAYNAEKFIDEALQSIFSQSFRDFGVVVVNDGSTDDTLRIVRKYEPRIKIFSKPNGGPASAKNVGIQNSSSEYITFLDADDIWLGNSLERQVEFMEDNPQLGFAYGDALCFYSENDVKKEKTHLLACDLEGHLFKELFWSCFIPNSTVIVRRKCLDKVGLFDESKKILGAEDFDLWLRLSLHFQLGHIPHVLAKYRLHSRNLIGNSYEKAFPLHLNIYRKLFRDCPEIRSKLEIGEFESIGDLCLRYSYKNFIEGDMFLAIKKCFLATFYAPTKAVSALHLIVGKNRDHNEWSKIIPNFKLWHQIVGSSW